MGPRTMTERVCVVGATGHLGIAVVEELRSRNVSVVAVARNSSSRNISRLREVGATVEFVDASNVHESYATAVASATTAISCLAAGMKYVDKTSDFWAIDRDATIRFGLEAIKAGIKHLMLVATFEGKDSRHMSAFTDAKEQAVDELRDKCETMGVTFTVIRANAYFKDLTTFAFERVLKGNSHMVLGDGSRRINPISREDVAVFMADCVQNKTGGEFPMGGPDTFTFREIGTLAAQVIGNAEQLRIRTVPLWMLRLTAMVLSIVGVISRKARRDAALQCWMVYVSTHDAVAPCYGKRRLVDEYKRMYEEYKHKTES